MKTSKQKIDAEDLSKSSEQTIDPFAVDFFGVEESSDSEELVESKTLTKKNNQSEKRKNVKGLNWTNKLPKMTIQEANFSNQILELPSKISETLEKSLKETISRLINLEESQIECEMLFVGEVNLINALADLKKSSQVFLSVNFSPKLKNLLVAVNTEFATALIDLMLGGSGKSSDTMRPLSSIEQTIFEFISINFLKAINDSSENLQLKLQTIGNEINLIFENYERGAEFVFELNCGDLGGNFTIILPNDLLNPLNLSNYSFVENQLKLERFNKLVKDLNLNIEVGETRINANDLPFLEKNDVILIEKPKSFWQNINEQNPITAYIGSGTNVYFQGKWKITADVNDFDVLSEEILLEIEEIISEKDTTYHFNRKKMDAKKEKSVENEVQTTKNIEENAVTNQIDEDLSDSTNSDEDFEDVSMATLENVMVNLRVNLGGRRLSLAELNKIRVGQIIELGCRPNDAVEIVADNENKPIAIGELIEIEGQLGVRLTKILV